MFFRQVFRIVFVIFSLYLMGDAFSRWDGFRYYASFEEFLPGVALALIIWSFVALSVSIPVWLAFRLFHRFCRLLIWKIKFEHLLFYAGMFALSGALAWKGKKILWPDIQTTIQVKSIVFFCVAFVSIFMTWFLRNKAEKWTVILQERITPLVWLFGIFIILSVPLVSYHAWLKDTDETVSKVSAETSAKDGNNPNIILVTFDALTARDMSTYGYHRPTTPFIREWARNATVFTMAEAESNFTTPAAASLMTGKRVWTHQTYHIEGTKPVRSNVETLPSVLKDYGYFNIALVVNPFASVRILGMSDSFDIAPLATEFSTSTSLFGWKFGIVDVILYRAFGGKIRLHNWIIKNDFILSKFINLISRNISQTTVPPDIVFNRFIDIVDNDLPTPYFAWIHVFPPHDPYLPPEPFMGESDGFLELREYKEQEKLIEGSYEYLFQYQPFPETMKPAVELMRNYYDKYIRYCDNTFEDFIVELNKRKIRNTVIILSADHGESFEHGYFTHGGPFLYEQVTHIPLIIREPGQDRGQVVNDLVEQIDIPATILDFADIQIPLWMEGRSLVPLIRGESLPLNPAFSMNFEENPSRGHQITKGSIAVWEDDYKLIHYLEKKDSLLFNIKSDPDEMNNLFDKEKEKGEHLLGLIQYNLEKANEMISAGKNK
jgi:arylsulfatase A-like enzyme